VCPQRTVRLLPSALTATAEEPFASFTKLRRGGEEATMM
jgi:hypothetical protein